MMALLCLNLLEYTNEFGIELKSLLWGFIVMRVIVFLWNIDFPQS